MKLKILPPKMVEKSTWCLLLQRSEVTYYVNPICSFPKIVTLILIIAFSCFIPSPPPQAEHKRVAFLVLTSCALVFNVIAVITGLVAACRRKTTMIFFGSCAAFVLTCESSHFLFARAYFLGTQSHDLPLWLY